MDFDFLVNGKSTPDWKSRVQFYASDSLCVAFGCKTCLITHVLGKMGRMGPPVAWKQY